MPRLTTRKTTPLSPAKTRGSSSSPKQTRKPARTRSHEPSSTTTRTKRQQQRELVPVSEEIDTVPVRDEHNEQDDALSQRSSSGTDQVQRVSSLRASVYDDIAPKEPQREAMIRHLTELNFRADEILSRLSECTAQQLLDSLSDRHSPDWDDFIEDATKLEIERQYYGEDVDFLPIEELSREQATSNLHKVGANYVFAKANLALFIYRLLEAHPVETNNLLVTLSEVQPFPEVFATGIDPTHKMLGHSDDFGEQTIAMGVSIMTQRFIAQTKRQNSNVSQALKHAFYEKPHVFRNLSLELGTAAEQSAYLDLLQTTISEITQSISGKKKHSVDVDNLVNKYLWNEFTMQALRWTKARLEQINGAIDQLGGVRAIRHGLQHPAVRQPPASVQKKDRRSNADRGFIEKISFLADIDADLNADEEDPQQDIEDEDTQQHELDGLGSNVERTLEAEVQETPRAARILQEITLESAKVGEEVQETAQDNDAVNPVNDDDFGEQEVPDSAQSPSISSAMRPTQATTTILNNIQQQAREGNKENSPPTHPLRSQRQQDNTSISASAQPTSQLSAIQKGKRPRQDTTEEQTEDSDDAFETDNRQVTNKRPRAYIESIPQPTRDQPPPSTQPNPRHHNPVIRQPSTNASSHPPSSTAPPTSSAYSIHKTANTLAKRNTTLLTPITAPIHRPPQARRAWTAPEIERLMFLMRQYGCAWSSIKKADDSMPIPLLQGRSQVQLKDKARNMKMDFLKGEVELPAELVGVTISRAHKDTLRGMGLGWPGEDEEEEEV